jgi:hypothetical protein
MAFKGPKEAKAGRSNNKIEKTDSQNIPIKFGGKNIIICDNRVMKKRFT